MECKYTPKYRKGAATSFRRSERDEEMIRAYIRNQELADKQLDQMQLSSRPHKLQSSVPESFITAYGGSPSNPQLCWGLLASLMTTASWRRRLIQRGSACTGGHAMALKLLPAAAINFLRSRPGHGLVAVPLSLLIMTSAFAQDPTMSRRVGILMSGLRGPGDETSVAGAGGRPARARLAGGTQRNAGGA